MQGVCRKIVFNFKQDTAELGY